jgi:hypothetical protein
MNKYLLRKLKEIIDELETYFNGSNLLSDP